MHDLLKIIGVAIRLACVGFIIFVCRCLFSLSHPDAAYNFVVVICTLLLISTLLAYGDQKLFSGLLSFSLIIFLLLVGGRLGYVSETVFVYLTGFVILIFSILLAFMSFYIGCENSRQMQQLFLTVALGCPLLFALIGIVCPFGFYSGILISIIASFCNVLFNKINNSVGFGDVPGSPTTTNSPPQSPRCDRSEYPLCSSADFLAELSPKISMIPLTPRSHSSITIPPPSPSKTNWSITMPYFWRIGWEKNKNFNKNPNNYQLIETKVPLMSKDVKALSQKKRK